MTDPVEARVRDIVGRKILDRTWRNRALQEGAQSVEEVGTGVFGPAWGQLEGLFHLLMPDPKAGQEQLGQSAEYFKQGNISGGILEGMKGLSSQALEGADFVPSMAAFGGMTDVFHGTTKNFKKFSDPLDLVDDPYMLDRGLGNHFAADPEISNTFVMDMQNAVALEGGNIIPTTIPDDKYMLEISQPKYDWAKRRTDFKSHQGVLTDQTAIERAVMLEAYKKDKNMLARYLEEARRMPADEAKEAAEAMSGGGSAFMPLEGRSYTLDEFVEDIGGKPFNAEDRRRAIELARKSWSDQGYKGIKYINTSPNEMLNAEDATSYIVFNPDDAVPMLDPPNTKRADDAIKLMKPIKAGDEVSGLRVGNEIPNTSSIRASLDDYEEVGLMEVPMSMFGGVGGADYAGRTTTDLQSAIARNRRLDPLIVVVDGHADGPAYILEGAHRIDAAADMGLESVPALVIRDTSVAPQ